MLGVRDGADVVATAEAFRLGASAIEGRLAELVGTDGARTLLLFTFGHTQSTQTHRQAAEFGALVRRAAAGRRVSPPAPSPLRPSSSSDHPSRAGSDIILAGLAT